MSHSVTYVIDMNGKAFNDALADERRAAEADFHNLVRAGSLWDGRLTHQQTEFSVELTGVVTILWLTTKYSRILADQEELKRLLEFERHLIDGVPNRRIVRLDELLLTQWECTAGEFWFREADAANRFFPWVEKQPKEAWTLVAPPA